MKIKSNREVTKELRKSLTEEEEDRLDTEFIKLRLEQLEKFPERLIKGEELEKRLLAIRNAKA